MAQKPLQKHHQETARSERRHNLRAQRMISALFAVAAVYDGLLGSAFLIANRVLFSWFGVTPPNHPGYVQFPAALLIIFAIMFIAVAVNPSRNGNLIPYGILLKVAYCGVVSYHWFTTDLPNLWKPFCIFDLIFLIFFCCLIVQRSDCTKKVDFSFQCNKIAESQVSCN